MRGNLTFHGVTNVELAPIKRRTTKQGAEDVPFFTRDIVIHSHYGDFEVTLFSDTESGLGVQERFI